MAHQKVKRNRKIYELYSNPENHFSMNALAKMFQISPPMVWKIIDRENRRESTKEVKFKEKLAEGDE